MSHTTKKIKIQVEQPSGTISQKAVNAPRLDSLANKTLLEGSPLEGWKSNETFPLIRKLLTKKYPGLKIIPYNEFPKIHLSPLRLKQKDSIDKEEIGEILNDMNCDGLILGNGG